MDSIINTKDLRGSLPEIVARVRRGERFTVLYRSRPAFRLVPVTSREAMEAVPLEEDPLYRAGPLGRCSDGLMASDHDRILYGEPARGESSGPTDLSFSDL